MNELDTLREAVRLTPHNIPLRRHLADTLLKYGMGPEAEQEYRDALALAPDDLELKLGLARAFFQQGRGSHALVLVEGMANCPTRRDASTSSTRRSWPPRATSRKR